MSVVLKINKLERELDAIEGHTLIQFSLNGLKPMSAFRDLNHVSDGAIEAFNKKFTHVELARISQVGAKIIKPELCVANREMFKAILVETGLGDMGLVEFQKALFVRINQETSHRLQGLLYGYPRSCVEGFIENFSDETTKPVVRYSPVNGTEGFGLTYYSEQSENDARLLLSKLKRSETILRSSRALNKLYGRRLYG
jgi:hypothetical protein